MQCRIRQHTKEVLALSAPKLPPQHSARKRKYGKVLSCKAARALPSAAEEHYFWDE